MSTNSNIEWTETTWNPVTGCTEASTGCANCYARGMSKRLAAMARADEAQGKDPGKKAHYKLSVLEDGRWSGVVSMVPDALPEPLSWKKPRRVFVNSMSDLFWGTPTDLKVAKQRGVKDPQPVPFEFIDQVFAVMALCPQHTFQVLTKRPERMAEYLNEEGVQHRIAKQMDVVSVQRAMDDTAVVLRGVPGFPGYKVSNLGQVVGPRGQLSPCVGDQGHCRVTLYREGVRHRVLLHRLVLAVWERPPQDGEQACHINGDPTCNALVNLKWGTQADNWEDRKRHGNHRSYSKLGSDDVEEIRRLLRCGHSAESLGRRFRVSATQIRNIDRGDQWATGSGLGWPLRNVWKGTSVENQATADERIPHLLKCPASVRWLSMEPLLGAVNLAGIKVGGDRVTVIPLEPHGGPEARADSLFIDWVVLGGESGKGARPMHPDWARSVRDQCQAAGVPFFFKQWGAWVSKDLAGNYGARTLTGNVGLDGSIEGKIWGTNPPPEFMVRVGKKSAGRLLDGRTWDEYPAVEGVNHA